MLNIFKILWKIFYSATLLVGALSSLTLRSNAISWYLTPPALANVTAYVA